MHLKKILKKKKTEKKNQTLKKTVFFFNNKKHRLKKKNVFFQTLGTSLPSSLSYKRLLSPSFCVSPCIFFHANFCDIKSLGILKI